MTDRFEPRRPLSPAESRVVLPEVLQTPAAELWPAPVVRRKDRLWLHVLLVLLTLVTTTIAGVDHYLAFRNTFVTPSLSLSLVAHGLAYSLTILAILGAHEMGHYVACRHYGIDATLPFFLPAPFILTGTFGAVIRIRQPIFHKSALFDIGIAGPIAGFVDRRAGAVPRVALVHRDAAAQRAAAAERGVAVARRAAALQVRFMARAGARCRIRCRSTCTPWRSPRGSACLMTALNLFPIAQLDGGHISYAVFGRRATWITYAGFLVALSLSLVSYSWVFWTVTIAAMLFMAGPRHPPVMDEDMPLIAGTPLAGAGGADHLRALLYAGADSADGPPGSVTRTRRTRRSSEVH